MKKYLVTGGLGFIGSNFINTLFDNLVQAGESFEIHCVDKETYAASIKNLNSNVINSKQFLLHKKDIASEDVRNLIRDNVFEYCAHFAAESHVDRSIQNPLVFIETNVVGTANLLHAWKDFQTGRFLHVSTDEVYGSLNSGEAEEQDPLDPSSPYSASKAASDLLVLSYIRTYKIDAVVSRCTNNYGLNQNHEKLIPKMIENMILGKPLTIYADGSNIREWIHVLDHVAALLMLLRAKKLESNIYNIGSNVRLSNMEILSEIKKVNPTENIQVEHTSDRPGHDFRYAVNSERIQKELNWSTKLKLTDGLKELVENYKKFHSFEKSAEKI